MKNEVFNREKLMQQNVVKNRSQMDRSGQDEKKLYVSVKILG